jgi:hypothetical protein
MTARKSVVEEETLFEKLRKEVIVPDPLRVTEDIVLSCPTKTQLEQSQQAPTELEANRILLGEENYEKLDELFGPESPQMWVEFNKAYISHFFPTQTA